MSKKIQSIIIMVLMLFAIPTFAFADNNETIETEELEITENEVIVLSDNFGAQVRLLQLERRVDIQIENAELIMLKIEENNITVDDEKLNEIIAGFYVIKNKIGETDLNQNASVLATEFVALKNESINLTKEFRETVRDLFREEQKVQLRNTINENKEMKLTQRDERNQRIENLKVDYNVRKTSEIMNRYKLNVSQDIVNMVRSEEFNPKQIRERVQNELQKLDVKNRVEVMQKALEEKTKENIHAKNARDELINTRNEQKIEVVQRIRDDARNLINENQDFRQQIRDSIRIENQQRIDNNREEIVDTNNRNNR